MGNLRTDRLLVVVLIAMAFLLSTCEWASAQVAPDFVAIPHPTFPWHYPWALANGALREIEVAPRPVVIPMEVTQPGSLPPMIEWQYVTLPGYRVTEKINGFIIHGHWGVRLVDNAYYWTWVPTYFRGK